MEHYLSLLTNAMKKGWNDTALSDFEGDKFTYGEVALQIEKLHIMFRELGISKGDRVALCAGNSARWAISFLAVNAFEAVAVPLLNNFTVEIICNLTAHSQSRIMFTDREIWKNLDPAAMPELRAAVCIRDFTLLWCCDPSFKDAATITEHIFRKKYPYEFTIANVNYNTGNAKDLAVINYTSGTTSTPKGVMLRHECLSASIDFAIRRIPCGRKNRILSMLPMGHTYGLVFEFLYPVCSGASVCFLGRRPSTQTLLDAMSQVQPFLVITVPLIMEKIYRASIQPVLEKPMMKAIESIPVINRIAYGIIERRIRKAFGGKVRQFIMGGAALSPEAENAFMKIGLPYTVGYGMTEAAPLLAYSDHKDFVPGTCGRKVDAVEIRIDSQDPENIPGEIQAKGTNICSGYYNNPEASHEAFTDDGFLRTGDLGTVDRKGNITIRGRSKNMILTSNGQNIYPEEVEAVVNAREFVLESLVIERSSKIVALVYPDEAGIRRSGIHEDEIKNLEEHIRVSSNCLLPKFSQLAKVELVREPFKKTPKMSIMRYLYK